MRLGRIGRWSRETAGLGYEGTSEGRTLSARRCGGGDDSTQSLYGHCEDPGYDKEQVFFATDDKVNGPSPRMKIKQQWWPVHSCMQGEARGRTKSEREKKSIDSVLLCCEEFSVEPSSQTTTYDPNPETKITIVSQDG